MKTPPSLAGRNILITGATGGIGRSIAFRLIQEKCSLWLTGRSDDALTTLITELSVLKSEECIVDGSICNLTLETEIETLVTNAKESLKHIDILIHCAGIFPIGNILETTTQEFDDCFSINVRSSFLLTKLLLPDMQKERWGRIVNIGSSSAYNGFANTATYCASKHAILGLSRSLFHECKKDNIRVFCLSPGSVKTDMGKKVIGQDYDTFIEPEDIAEHVLFLLRQNGNSISEEVRINRLFIQ